MEVNARIRFRPSPPPPAFHGRNLGIPSKEVAGEPRGTETLGSCSDEDVEFPVFVDDCALEFHKNDDESLNRLIDDDEEDELISDDDDDRSSATRFSSISSRVEGLGFRGPLSVGIEKEREGNDAWDSFCKDADEIVNGNIMSRSLRKSRICRSDRGKSKSKLRSRCSYSFRCERSVESAREDHDDPFESHWLDGSEDTECRSVECAADLACGDEIVEADDDGLLVGGGCHEHGVARNSMAELLDELRCMEESVVSIAKPRGGKKGRRRRAVMNRGESLVGSRSVDDEDAFEDLHSGSSSDDGRDAGNLCATSVNGKIRSVADQFDEALGADEGSIVAVPRVSNAGLLGRLQSLMQREKEQDLDFSRKLYNKATTSNEANSMIVKILSKSFEAKLTVCCCSICDKSERWEESYQGEAFGKTTTVIFSSRICGGIELEVGKVIRIHAPWKEVEVLGEGDTMILATYFSYV